MLVSNAKTPEAARDDILQLIESELTAANSRLINAKTRKGKYGEGCSVGSLNTLKSYLQGMVFNAD